MLFHLADAVRSCRFILRFSAVIAGKSAAEKSGTAHVDSVGVMVGNEREQAVRLLTSHDLRLAGGRREWARRKAKDLDRALTVIGILSLDLRTKNFHWHMSGPHFRDYHLLLDDHGEQLFAMTDDIASG